jgi:hypothetical protein
MRAASPRTGLVDPRRCKNAIVLSPWFIVVRGDDADLAAIGELCASSTERSLAEEQPGELRLRSSTVAAAAGHEEAWPALCELLVQLSDTAAAAAYTRLRLTPGALGRTRPDGGTDVFVHAEAAHLRLRALPPTVSVNGITPEPLHERLLRLQAANDHLRLALHFLNADLSWFNLWKAFEAIRDGNHGEKRLVVNGWVNDAEIRRFRSTANSYSAVGDDARHAKLGTPAPSNPMTLEVADDFVRDLLSRWVASLP